MSDDVLMYLNAVICIEPSISAHFQCNEPKSIRSFFCNVQKIRRELMFTIFFFSKLACGEDFL